MFNHDPKLVLVDKEELYNLKAALFLMLEEKIGFMDANRLGDPYKTHSVKIAQKALGEDFDIFELEKVD